MCYIVIIVSHSNFIYPTILKTNPEIPRFFNTEKLSLSRREISVSFVSFLTEFVRLQIARNKMKDEGRMWFDIYFAIAENPIIDEGTGTETQWLSEPYVTQVILCMITMLHNITIHDLP